MSPEGISSAKSTFLFRKVQRHRCRIGVTPCVKNILMSINKTYYEPGTPPAFSTLEKLAPAVAKTNKSDVRAWLQKQDADTLHRPVRKLFLRNPYTVVK